jgi:hypothetical protein
MLYFIYEEGRAADFLPLYEKYAGQLRWDRHHYRAAKIYVAKKRPEDAREALRTMAKKAWCPVEYMQMAPMEIWEHDDLCPLLTPSFGRELLELSKGQS